MHTPYSKRYKHDCDFKVKYRIYEESEGGINSLPHQGFRFDFQYEIDYKNKEKQQWMIWPEFEDSDGNLIKSGEINRKGIARMWVANPQLRDFHLNRIEIGTVGYFTQALHIIGKCEVIEIVGLKTNPKSL